MSSVTLSITVPAGDGKPRFRTRLNGSPGPEARSALATKLGAVIAGLTNGDLNHVISESLAGLDADFAAETESAADFYRSVLRAMRVTNAPVVAADEVFK